MDWLTQPESWIALITLTALEIVLGIDNIVFLSITTSRLPAAQQPRARFLGLALAMIGRVVLLLSITWIMGLSATLFTVAGREVSWRDMILMAGGLFLLAKATHEIHQDLEGPKEEHVSLGRITLRSAMVQILLLDVVFSLDSVITAVGMARHVEIMILAIVIAIVVMMLTAKAVSQFIHDHPTVKMLALSFLLLVGVALIADGLHFHIPRGYIYFAMAFSVFVELLNLKVRRKAESSARRSNGTVA